MPRNEDGRLHVDGRTWLQMNLDHGFGGGIVDWLLEWAPRTHFVGPFPPGLEFLRGAWADLGFEHLGLSPDDLRRLRRAYSGWGVLVPGTSYRLRCERSMRSRIEEADGREIVTLPSHWMQGACVCDPDDRLTFLGKRHPSRHFEDFDDSPQMRNPPQ